MNSVSKKFCSCNLFSKILSTSHDHQVVYYLGIPSKGNELQLPNCDVLCPIDKFLQLIEDVTPSNEEMICDKGLSSAFVDKKTIEELDLLKYNLIKTAGVID